MSLSDISWNHLHLLNQFPARPDSTADLYSAPARTAAFINHDFSRLSSAYSNHRSHFNMNTLSTEEMERFQKLSNEFEPEIQASVSIWASAGAAADTIAGTARVSQTINQRHCHGVFRGRSHLCRENQRTHAPVEVPGRLPLTISRPWQSHIPTAAL